MKNIMYEKHLPENRRDKIPIGDVFLYKNTPYMANESSRDDPSYSGNRQYLSINLNTCYMAWINGNSGVEWKPNSTLTIK